MRFLKALFALIIVIAIIAGGAGAYGWFWLQGEIAKPGPLPAEYEFTIESGEALASVATRLEGEGLIEEDRKSVV